MVVFLPMKVAETKIIFGYTFGVPSVYNERVFYLKKKQWVFSGSENFKICVRSYTFDHSFKILGSIKIKFGYKLVKPF